MRANAPMSMPPNPRSGALGSNSFRFPIRLFPYPIVRDEPGAGALGGAQLLQSGRDCSKAALQRSSNSRPRPLLCSHLTETPVIVFRPRSRQLAHWGESKRCPGGSLTELLDDPSLINCAAA